MTLPPAYAAYQPLHRRLEFSLGVAYERRLAPVEAALEAVRCGYSHFYVNLEADGVPPFDASVLQPICGGSRTKPLVHSSFRHAIASPVAVVREAALAAMLREAAVAARLAAPLILHGTIDPTGEAGRYDLGQAMRDFDGCLAALEQRAPRGVALWLENLPSREAAVFARDREFEEILRQHPQVRFVLDVGHGHIGQDPVALFDQHHRSIVALSLSDNDGTRDAHGALGTGDIDYSELLACIRRHDWHGILVFDNRDVPAAGGIAYLSRLDALSGRDPRPRGALKGRRIVC